MKKLLMLLLLLLSTTLTANVEALRFETPEQEALYKSLIAELRCLVCQNQNIADSNAELAQDLRKKTYELVNQGMDEDEIITYMVDRYGDFVMYRPPLKSTTLFLWIGPFLILAVALVAMLLFVRKRRRSLPSENEEDPQLLKTARELLEREKE